MVPSGWCLSENFHCITSVFSVITRGLSSLIAVSLGGYWEAMTLNDKTWQRGIDISRSNGHLSHYFLSNSRPDLKVMTS